MGPTSEFNRTSAEHRNRLVFSVDGETFLKTRLYQSSISSADVTIPFFGDLFFSRRLVNFLPCQEGSQEVLLGRRRMTCSSSPLVLTFLSTWFGLGVILLGQYHQINLWTCKYTV
jgi:hypothetical protein